ncbi:hypothetical protein ES703_94429 [subsurface metagenome]
MGIVVDRGTAGVQADLIGVYGTEVLNLPAQGVE